MTSRDESIDRAKRAIASKDRETAIALLQPLAAAGDRDAQFLMGSRFFCNLDLVPVTEALQWLARASDAGHAEATYELALFRSGDDFGLEYGPPTTEESVNLLMRAGELGCVRAQYDLGALYATGDWAGPKDAAEARRWYRRAAEQGHGGAQSNLGAMLLDGEGGEIDEVEGLRWLEAAAAQDEIQALEHLQYIYREGAHGVPVNLTRADEYRRREDAFWERHGRTDEEGGGTDDH
jgi:TPR repeat protein